MKNIVKVENNELLVSLDDIAYFSNIKYESIRRLVSKNINEFNELGLSYDLEKVDFKSTLLNEPQTTFLITLMRNNNKVTRFKLELVKQFYSMKNRITNENKNILEFANELHKIQLQKKDKQITEAKRKAYAHTREGNYQCVTNIIRDTNAKISSNVLNKILLEKKYLKQKEVTVKKYEANNKESITSLDGNILIHYDTAIAVLKDFEIEFEEDEQMKIEF